MGGEMERSDGLSPKEKKDMQQMAKTNTLAHEQYISYLRSIVVESANHYIIALKNFMDECTYENWKSQIYLIDTMEDTAKLIDTLEQNEIVSVKQ